MLVNQSYFSNNVVLNLTQHVSEKTQFSLALGYEFAPYTATAANVIATRRDNFFYVRPNITYAFGRSLSSSLFYQLSGFGASSFERNSAGIMLNYAF